MNASHIDLPEDTVHIHRASFTALIPNLDLLKKLLSPEEIERSEQYYFARHRDAYILGRGYLRTLLARYIGTDPCQIAFEYAAHGKPRLTPAQASIRFNVSHSGDLFLCAVSRNRELGIDCEALRENIELESMADRYFSDYETEILLGLPPHQRVRAFFTCWTRKEAYIKAHGDGLSMPLDTFSVTLAPEEPAALLTCDDPDQLDRWELHDLTVPEPYAAALVTSGKRAQITYIDEKAAPGMN
ncbi:MAG: 4'-phosphopantetheinyl transferase superfamily protein [FCB group bacterium]|jgi:4'-phosphopantetheinyl transferase|nr:4'-phosphopantetheinyl transferase superfamily protein [FCB group bacterium]